MKMHLALKALLLGVLVGCAVPYGIFTWASGIDDMIELGLLPDEGHVTVTLLRDGRGVPGDRIVLRTRPETIVLTTNDAGQVQFPVSLRLREQSPWMEIRSASGPLPLWSRKIGWGANLTFDCDPENAGALVHGDLATLETLEVGPDALHYEAGLAPPMVEAHASRLAASRRGLRDFFGIDPPPIAVAVLNANFEHIRFPADAKGRPVWVVGAPNEMAKEYSKVVHEWAHQILSQDFEMVDDPADRFLEDGLCEWSAHWVEKRSAASEASWIAADRYESLRDMPTAARFDLQELAEDHSPYRNGDDMASILDTLCNDLEGGIGYAVGLAFWLSQEEADPDYWPRVRARLATEKLSDALGADPPGLDREDLSREAVLAVLARNARSDSDRK